MRVESYTTDWDKSRILAEALKIELPLDLVWSCYEAGPARCWRCESCKRSERALLAAGPSGAAWAGKNGKMSLFTKFLSDKIPYTGAELAPHWIAARTGEFRSAVVAFRGPCLVATGEMVDLEDRFQNARIEAKEMLHFLGEWFEGDLSLAVARQRLLIAGFAEFIRARLTPERAKDIRRRGNDLFVGDSKLSVSIVTATPVSTLFHFGVNIDFTGAPVQAAGLELLGIDPAELASVTLSAWAEEWRSMEKARCKVAPR